VKSRGRPFHYGLGWTCGGLVVGWAWVAVSFLVLGGTQAGGTGSAAVMVLLATLEGLLGFASVILVLTDRLPDIGARRASLAGVVAGSFGVAALVWPLGVLSTRNLLRLVVGPLAIGVLLGLLTLVVIGMRWRRQIAVALPDMHVRPTRSSRSAPHALLTCRPPCRP
jgi:hypothetical protein